MFLDYFRPRLYNPKTGERWIERPSPIDAVLAYALAAGAILFFVLVTLSMFTHARTAQHVRPAKTRVAPARSIHPIRPQAKSLAEHNADMFRGSRQALDELGNFPTEPAKPAQRKEKRNDAKQ